MTRPVDGVVVPALACPACGPSTFGEACPVTGGARCNGCHEVVVPEPEEDAA